MRTLLVAATALVLATTVLTANASTVTTPASGGTSLSADLAQNGVAPAWTTLGSIVIAEASNNDFKTSGTLILTAPSGWRFNTAAAISATPGKVGGGSTAIDISASVGAITAAAITINITVNAAARLDNLMISGIQVQSIEGGNLSVAGNILRSSGNTGTATIVGVVNDATNFGSLSQAAGALRLFVVLPGQSFADGASIAASGISGAPASQVAGAAFNLVELVAADREFNVSAAYSGAKTIAYAGAGGAPSYTTNVSFTGGHSTTALATTLHKAESVALSATSATAPAIGTGLPSANFSVAPGPAAKLQILLPGESAAPGTGSGKTGAPTAQTVGVSIVNNVRVNAVDADWNAIGSAAPDVVISSSDGAAAIADDNGGADGNLSLAAGAGILSSFTFGIGGGSQTVTATDFAGALSPSTSASVMVNKPASSTSVISSQNPAVFGQSVTFTATVSGASGTPTGAVDFKDGAAVIAAAVPLDGSGVASFATSSLSAATHTISAVYSGSAIYAASNSANLSQVVNKASTSTALASSLNPSCSGAGVTLTATVGAVAPGSGIPTGSVNFKDGSTVIGSSIPLNASGAASFTTSSLSAANHNLTVIYNGSASFNTSTSAVLVQAVKAKPTAAVSGSTSICPGGSTNIQAVLGGTAPWTVTWSDGVVQSGVMASPASRSVSPAATTIYTVTNVADAYCSNNGSGSATVTVNALPAISAQPSAKIVCEGNTATFTVAASGTSITYRWRKNGVNLSNGGNISGATSATLTIGSAAAADAGSYDVVVSGICPPAQTSNAVSLTVNPRPIATITAASLICAGTPGNTASVPNAGAGASYAWNISNGTITGGAGTAGITYTAGPNGSSLTLSVTVTGPNGCSTSSSKAVALSTGGVAFEDWTNVPLNSGSWDNSTLQAKRMLYPEGGTIPYRITMPQPCVGSTWSITLQYDFVDNATGVHFCDFLTSYNAYEAYVNGHACDDQTCTGQSTFPIPADGDLAYQIPGGFTVENGTITSVSAYSTDMSGGITRKSITLSGTATPGADVVLLFGAHMARDYEWGSDKGAHEWPSGTATVGFLNYMGTAGHTNVKISDSILDNPSDSDLSIIALDSPDPVGAGHNLSYSIIAYNSGPLAASPDTVSDWVPVGTTFVSATTPSGWAMTTPPVGGTGLVRWILPTTFAPSASASFGLVVAVNAGATGTVENAAILGSSMVDAYQTNNVSYVSTTVIPTCTQPVLSLPANIVVDLAPGQGTANVDFAVNVFGSPTPVLTLSANPGSAFPVGTTMVTASAINACGSISDSFSVTVVDHVPPVITLVGDSVITIALHSTFNDPGATAIDAGAGNLSPLIHVSGAVNINVLGTYVLTYTVTDPSGNTITVTRTVNVVDTGSLVSVFRGPLCGSMLSVGNPLALSGSFSDNTAGTHTAQWTIDQDAVAGTVDEARRQVSGSYTFPAPGVYLMGLTVTNQTSAMAIASQTSSAIGMVVAFDPAACFVGGDGWIDSPAGAWAEDLTSAGKASFGFEARYVKGAGFRITQSELYFVYGDFSFHSTQSNGLQLLDGEARLTGTGTVNGSGDYAFLVAIKDGKLTGDTDRFRIRITDRNTNAVVYDSQPGDPDNATAALAIGCGQIEMYTTRGVLSTRANGGAETEGAQALPSEFALAQNFPNPCVGSTRLRFDLPEASMVRIGIYDVLGREVASVVSGRVAAGRHEQQWDARSGDRGPVSPGVYFVRMNARGLSGGGAFTMQRRLVLLP